MRYPPAHRLLRLSQGVAGQRDSCYCSCVASWCNMFPLGRSWLAAWLLLSDMHRSGCIRIVCMCERSTRDGVALKCAVRVDVVVTAEFVSYTVAQQHVYGSMLAQRPSELHSVCLALNVLQVYECTKGPVGLAIPGCVCCCGRRRFCFMGWPPRTVVWSRCRADTSWRVPAACGVGPPQPLVSCMPTSRAQAGCASR